MDKIQTFLITSGRKDLAQDYFLKYSFLQDQQITNMVNQFAAKNNIEDKKHYFIYAEKLNSVIKNLSVDFKTEKILLIWLLEQIHKKEIINTRLDEDLDIIQENLSLYFKNRRQIDKNIFKYNYSDVKKWVSDFKDKGRDPHEFLSKPDYQGGPYKIYKITDVDTCIKIGQGTSWCIKGASHARHYLSKGLLYLVTKDDKKFALLSFAEDAFYDIYDKPLKRDIKKDIFNYLPDEIFKIAFKKNKNFIEFIKNPSEKIQLSAVEYNGDLIAYIKNPSKKVELAAFNNNPMTIQFIKNPSEEMQLKAVREHSWLIEYIENPSEKVKLESSTKN